jgi:hypothetical protein
MYSSWDKLFKGVSICSIIYKTLESTVRLALDLTLPFGQKDALTPTPVCRLLQDNRLVSVTKIIKVNQPVHRRVSQRNGNLQAASPSGFQP